VCDLVSRLSHGAETRSDGDVSMWALWGLGGNRRVKARSTDNTVECAAF